MHLLTFAVLQSSLKSENAELLETSCSYCTPVNIVNKINQFLKYGGITAKWTVMNELGSDKNRFDINLNYKCTASLQYCKLQQYNKIALLQYGVLQ